MEATSNEPAATSDNPETVKALAAEVAGVLAWQGADPIVLRDATHNPAAFLQAQGEFVTVTAESTRDGVKRTYHPTATFRERRALQLAPAIKRRDALRAAVQQPAITPKPRPVIAPPPPPPALSADLLADALELVESGDSAGLRMLANRAGRNMADVARLAREFGAKQPHFDGVRVALLDRAWAALNRGDRDELTRLANRTGKGWAGLHVTLREWKKSLAVAP